MATIKDVAGYCGVSIATVSAVINNASWVPSETRARVKEGIRAVGYRPNRLAQGLKTRQSNAIGVIVSDLTNPFFTEIVRAIEHTLREQDRNLFLCDSDQEFDFGDRNLQMLLEKQVDGLILIGASVRERTIREYIERDRPVPMVAIERDYDIDGVSKLLVDSEQGAFEATRHLIDQGYKRIALISGPGSGPGGTTFGRAKRNAGYEKALREAGLPVIPELIVEGDFRFTGGQRAMEKLLSLPKPPDAVFAANDLMAIGALRVARARGVRVPEDLGLVGNDDIPSASFTSPPLTTLAMPKKALGRAAAQLLLSRISGTNGNEPIRRTFSVELVVRESSIRTPVHAE